MGRLSLSKIIMALAALNLCAAAFMVASFSFYRSSQNEVTMAHTTRTNRICRRTNFGKVPMISPGLAGPT
jgi:hypothetical protein